MMKEAEKEMEKTCIDCAAYLIASSDELTEYGICLNDEAFEPFIDDLIEMRFASCRELVEQKKFVGDDRPACPDFEDAESIEIDDESPLGQEVRRLAEAGELTPDTLEDAILEDRLRQIDFKTVPVAHHEERLRSNVPKERDDAISNLGGFIALGNLAAFQVLLRFLASLATPQTIEEVHLKKEILHYLSIWKDKKTVAPFLIEELGRIGSNNTTRQWISAILEFLERCPFEVIEEPLHSLLSEKRFSYNLRKKVMDTLSRAENAQDG